MILKCWMRKKLQILDLTFPCMHLEEISIFSLHNVTVRLTKIMNNLLEHLKILIFKVIFQCWKSVEIFHPKISVTRRPTFIKFFFWKFGFLKYFIFLKYAQFLLALFIILVGLMVTLLVKKCLFLLDAYMVSCPTPSKNLWRYLLSNLTLTFLKP